MARTRQEYLQELANDMGIPISSLTIEISGYGKEQGTQTNSRMSAIKISIVKPFRISARLLNGGRIHNMIFGRYADIYLDIFINIVTRIKRYIRV
ncbi:MULTISPECIES: hypothetical protein [Nostoc]|uniref:Uncharacterized protein n=2 Tax=Nostoc TaxID=1177 RepID=A0ABR8IG26_9NOSO|nr:MULTISPECIES: hypothetical protein [Nostoc]MBD2564275.1 hypothetical protein [Nostoc linckia FACHB-391]MBD2650559.1 hypothetical protein [Nostoc foliaceum FACHB-393]